MIKYIIGIFLCITILSVNAQEQEIKKRFLLMQDALLKKDFNKSLAYTTDELFELVTKEQLIAVMEATFKNPRMEIKSDLPKVLNISKVFNVKGKFYAILETSGFQKIRILDENKKALDLSDRFLYARKLKFDQLYGPENVSFDEETKFFKVNVHQNIVAISLDGKTNWKYLAIDNLQLEVITKLLPQEVLNKILQGN